MKSFSEFQALPERLPDLYVVGGPKCGTTSVFHWLKKHNQTFLTDKEPNFLCPDVFDIRDLPESLKSWKEYTDKICPLAAKGKICGDFTPRYLYSDMALNVIANQRSKPLVVALLRNPIDLCYALHGQMLKQGLEDEEDFQKAWRRAVDRGNDPESWRTRSGLIDRRLDYPLYGKLGVRVRKYMSALDPKCFRVFILEEEMANNPRAVYDELLNCLNLEPVSVQLDRVNERKEFRSLALQRAMIRTRDVVRKLRFKLTGGRTIKKRRGTGLMKLVNRLNETQGSSAELSVDQRKAMAEFFRSDVLDLFDAIGRPIDAWSDFSVDRKGF